MDFKQLESFIAIAKYKSFSRAAESLFLTQPTLSNHIISLEKELGTLLFNRMNKKVSLTDVGELFFQHALDIINSRDRALFSLNQFKGEIAGTLEISSSTVPQHYFLGDLIQEFAKKYPNVRYKILRHDSHQVLDKISRGEVDFGIVGQQLPIHNVRYHEIMGDEIQLLAHKDFPKDTLAIDELKGVPLILREKGSATRQVLLLALTDHGIALEDLAIKAEIENTATIKQFVSKGIGLSFISNQEILSDGSCENLKVIPIENFRITRSFYFAYNEKIAFSPLCEAFKNFIFDKNQK